MKNMQINAFISCILCIYLYKCDHKCMLSWFKMIKKVVFMYKIIVFYFHDLIKIYDILSSKKYFFLNYKMKFLFISHFKCIY